MEKKLQSMLGDIAIPKVVKIKQEFVGDKLDDVRTALWKKLENSDIQIKEGSRIAITGGSRGITGYQLIMKTVVAFVKEKGGVPFIVPAMGSHGGATAEGQKAVLEGYEIREETVGAPIVSSMEVRQIGITDKGFPVYIDKNAWEADGIILLNRIKYHTSFQGRYESGLIKMLAIGLAKHKGAMMTHRLGFSNMAQNVISVGKVAIDNLNIVCGVATLENSYNEVADVFVLKKKELLEKEPEILEKSKSMMAKICLDKFDVLIIKVIGKEISGAGIDTNVVGRFSTSAISGGPEIERVGILDLTEKSQGNGIGMGFGDFITKRLLDKVVIEDVYINALTNLAPRGAMIPITLPTDKYVFQACVKMSGKLNVENVKMVIISSTKDLDEIYMSEAAFNVVDPHANVQKCGNYREVPFDREGTLLLFKQ